MLRAFSTHPIIKAIRLKTFLNPNPVYVSCATRKNLHELHGIKPKVIVLR